MYDSLASYEGHKSHGKEGRRKGRGRNVGQKSGRKMMICDERGYLRPSERIKVSLIDYFFFSRLGVAEKAKNTL